MLNSAEIEQYHRDGYVTPDFHLDETTLDGIREAHARLINRHPEFSDMPHARVIKVVLY